MSDSPFGAHQFISWVRRGIGATVGGPPAAGQDRITVKVQPSIVDQNGNPYPQQPGQVEVQLYGHRDVDGIDPSLNSRTEPPNGTQNFEPNYLCSVEFLGPDLPWLLSPAGPTGAGASNSPGSLPSGDRLVPWIVLVVLKQGEFTGPTLTLPTACNTTSGSAPGGTSNAPPPPSSNHLPIIQVLNMGALQDLSDSWNWAHVEVGGGLALTDALANSTGSVISRLICPRRLDPETDYSAFVVPAYEAARLRGLGQDNTGVDSTTPAWTPKTAPGLCLPVYSVFTSSEGPQFQLKFRTSDAGDFESLVRRLNRVKDLPDSVGQRLMDVSVPGMGLPPASTKPLGLEGAFARANAVSTPWSPGEQATFQSSLQNLVNQTSPVVDDPSNPQPNDPVIVPPIYGRWPAGVTRVDASSGNWVNVLNLDPRTRAAAGLGTQVVQSERTQLLASAWQQVQGILEANQKIQQGQLARATLQQVHWNKFGAASTDSVLNFTAPLHSRVLTAPKKTVLAAVRSSHVPERALSPTFRRVTRPRRRLASPVAKRETLLRKINDKKVIIAPKPAPPQGLLSMDEVSEQREKLLHKRLLEILTSIEVARRSSHSITRRFFLTIALGFAAVGIGAAILGTEVWEELEELFAGRKSSERIRLSSFTPQQVAAIPARPNFALTLPQSPPVAGATGGRGDSAQAKAFRGATSDFFAATQVRPADPKEKPSLSLSSVQQTVLDRIDPDVTVPERIQAIVSLPRISWQPSDILASPILAAPEFPQAMYLGLVALSPSYLLPGADQVPPDSLCLMVQNHKFIESFMAGLNHEMTRQLIWEEYPIFDQRGTYFRQFLDVTAYQPQPGDPSDPAAVREMLKDIPPVTSWTKPLGQNVNQPNLAPNNVVLLIRGELFRRYPKTHVCAVKAKLGPDGSLVRDDSDQRKPIFTGTLPSDITFIGFNLSLDDARGGTAAAPQGFFFVFEQPCAEPRFGLEPTETAGLTTSWADLSWLNFATSTRTDVKKRVSMATTVLKLAGLSPWQHASQIFAKVLENVQLPDFLAASNAPSDMTSPLSDPVDQQNSWGQNSAQTAYILLRVPFRILIHAKTLLRE
jgi:hypothetical protein